MLVPVLLLHTIDVAETATRSEPCIFGSHAAALVLFSLHCEMGLDLVVHFSFQAAAADQTDDPPPQHSEARYRVFVHMLITNRTITNTHVGRQHVNDERSRGLHKRKGKIRQKNPQFYAALFAGSGNKVKKGSQCVDCRRIGDYESTFVSNAGRY